MTHYTLEQFEEALHQALGRFVGRDNIEKRQSWQAANGLERRAWRIYTDNYCYNLSASGGSNEVKGYLGCIASCRKPRAGEDWPRGSDLADGPLCEATWHRILADIVAYEMVKLHKPEKPKADIPALSYDASGGDALSGSAAQAE